MQQMLEFAELICGTHSVVIDGKVVHLFKIQFRGFPVDPESDPQPVPLPTIVVRPEQASELAHALQMAVTKHLGESAPPRANTTPLQ